MFDPSPLKQNFIYTFLLRATILELEIGRKLQAPGGKGGGGEDWLAISFRGNAKNNVPL